METETEVPLFSEIPHKGHSCFGKFRCFHFKHFRFYCQVIFDIPNRFSVLNNFIINFWYFRPFPSAKTPLLDKLLFGGQCPRTMAHRACWHPGLPGVNYCIIATGNDWYFGFAARSTTPGNVFAYQVAMIASHCRGGYHPPARYNTAIVNRFGRIRTVSDTIPFNGTLRHVRWREANSLPYTGWVITGTL